MNDSDSENLLNSVTDCAISCNYTMKYLQIDLRQIADSLWLSLVVMALNRSCVSTAHDAIQDS